MKTATDTLHVLLQGESAVLPGWLDELGWPRTRVLVIATVVGSALYGPAMGWWQAPRRRGRTDTGTTHWRLPKLRDDPTRFQ